MIAVDAAGDRTVVGTHRRGPMIAPRTTEPPDTPDGGRTSTTSVAQRAIMSRG